MDTKLIELENVERANGSKVKYFMDNKRQEVENKFRKYVSRHKVNISLLVCRKSKTKFLYALWW